MTDRRGDWIQTYGGRQYWPLDPRSDEVEITDIAHHLSLLCRFTGACEVFYSVAEHSVHVSHVVQATVAEGEWSFTSDTEAHRAFILRALLHDAAEAYCNDIARPVKRSIEGYAEIEGLNEIAICERFGLPGLVPAQMILLKQADNAMLLAETAALMKAPPVAWNPVDVPEKMQRAASVRGPDRWRWSAFSAEQNFLDRFHELSA